MTLLLRCACESRRVLLREQHLRAIHRGHRARPADVEREVRDHLDELLLRDAVLDRVGEVEVHLLGLAHPSSVVLLHTSSRVLIARRSSIARYPSATLSSGSVRSKTFPGSIFFPAISS